MPKLSIIIPAYNEAATIRQLLDEVWRAAVPVDAKELVIVESNSSDGTREKIQKFVAEKEALSPGSVKVLYQEKPKGKGNAVRAGFEVATGDIFLIQDGDLEYKVEDYPVLLEPILSKKARFVLGSRHLSAGHWRIRTFDKSPLRSTFMNFGGVLFHAFFNMVYRQKLTDPTTMFKVFERECIRKLRFESNRFEFDFELVAKLIRAGYTPFEVAVSYNSRGFEEGKKVRPFRDPLRFVWAILRFRFVPIYA
jgi:glycosyltransferase involved in cell wall biosynthesis